MIRFAFDLDGTLVDTEKLVRQAYEDVGVNPPQGFFGKPWQEWLDSEYLHEMKNMRYLELLEITSVEKLLLPCSEILRRTYGIVLTGASVTAAEAVLRRTRLGSFVTDLQTGLDLEAKKMILNNSTHGGIYFDNDYDACSYLTTNTERWEIRWVGMGR